MKGVFHLLKRRDRSFYFPSINQYIYHKDTLDTKIRLVYGVVKTGDHAYVFGKMNCSDIARSLAEV
jgi:hypothetical protein